MEAKKTTNHDEIKSWAEERNGTPAIVSGTEEIQEGAGLLRIMFSDEKENDLERTDWNTFFETFDDKSLAFLYQDKTKEGDESRFFKFVDRQ